MFSALMNLMNGPEKVKFWKTIILYVTFTTIGLDIAMIGPTLLDLQQTVGTNTTIDEISQIIPSRAGGYAAGTLAGKVLEPFR